MTKKIIIPIIATALFIAAVGILMQKTSTLAPTPKPTNVASFVTINGKEISVETAKTPEEREKGLSGVSSLDKDSGMLFVFENKSKTPVFWMKGMLIPLDIIWIKEDKIIRIDKKVPVPATDTPDNKIKTYSAGTVVDYVLEVNAGFSDSNSIKIGDSVTVTGI